MKPTLQEEEILKKYLSNILKFRETVDEVYDHTLSAVEDKPEDVHFQNTVNQVLSNDFGGGKGLVEMETQRLRHETWKGFVSISRQVKADFKFPNVLYTSLIFVLMFVITKYVIPKVQIKTYYTPLITMAATSLFLLLFKFLRGRFKHNYRRSILDIVIAMQCSLFNFFVLYLSMLIPTISTLCRLKTSQYEILITVILSICSLYILSAIKIWKDEVKFHPTT